MKTLPEHVRAFRRTELFTRETIPKGLLRDHATKEGVWALIQVREGTLEYTIGDAEVHVLDPGKNGVVEPMVPHHVTPLGEVSFYVEFYK